MWFVRWLLGFLHRRHKEECRSKRESPNDEAGTEDVAAPAKSGDGQAELPLMSICEACGKSMMVVETAQTIHPNCEP